MLYKGYNVTNISVEFSKRIPTITVDIKKGREAKTLQIPLPQTLSRAIEKELQKAINAEIKDIDNQGSTN